MFSRYSDTTNCDTCNDLKLNLLIFVSVPLTLIFLMFFIKKNIQEHQSNQAAEKKRADDLNKLQATTSNNYRHRTRVTTATIVITRERNEHDLEISDSENESSSEEEQTISNYSHDYSAVESKEKKPKPRRNWIEKSSSSTSHSDPQTDAPRQTILSSTASITKKQHEYDIKKQQNQKVIGKMNIHPELFTVINAEQATTLKNLCVNGKVIEGNSEGKTGLIFVKNKVTGESELKLKNCAKLYRFFGHHVPGKPSNEFEIDTVDFDHKKKKRNKKIVRVGTKKTEDTSSADVQFKRVS